jgi:predicted RNase H-like HicB family nuclease
VNAVLYASGVKVFEVKRDGVTYLLEESEAGGYVASVPGLDGCYSQGETLDEAVDNIEDAFNLFIGASRELGRTLPPQFANATARAI